LLVESFHFVSETFNFVSKDTNFERTLLLQINSLFLFWGWGLVKCATYIWTLPHDYGME